jgi:hypothetical protein
MVDQELRIQEPDDDGTLIDPISVNEALNS